MAPRDLAALKRDGETIDTIVSALADLDRLQPQSDRQRAAIAAIRYDLVAERATLIGQPDEKQGSLF